MTRQANLSLLHTINKKISSYIVVLSCICIGSKSKLSFRSLYWSSMILFTAFCMLFCWDVFECSSWDLFVLVLFCTLVVIVIKYILGVYLSICELNIFCFLLIYKHDVNFKWLNNKFSYISYNKKIQKMKITRSGMYT